MTKSLIRLAVLVLLVPPAVAEVEQPKPNEGATKVAVDGTRVEAEALSTALGHAVDAIILVRLEPAKEEGKAPTIRTYEGWSLDGKSRQSRGDKALAAQWKKAVLKMLEEAEDTAARKDADPRDLLGRLERALGNSGSHVVGDQLLSWSIGSSRSSAGGRESVARTAIVTMRPSDGRPVPTLRPRPSKGTVTPGPRGTPEPIRPPTQRPDGLGIGSSGASGESSADSRTGAKSRSRIEVDLGKAPKPAPQGTPTPR